MKARIKKTGESVDIISYNDISTTSISKYLVSYIDSQGVEHGREGTDYHLDFEPIDNLTHWQDVRERAAIAAMQGYLTSHKDIKEGHLTGRSDLLYIDKDKFKDFVAYADALIEQLKEK